MLIPADSGDWGCQHGNVPAFHRGRSVFTALLLQQPLQFSARSGTDACLHRDLLSCFWKRKENGNYDNRQTCGMRRRKQASRKPTVVLGPGLVFSLLSNININRWVKDLGTEQPAAQPEPTPRQELWHCSWWGNASIPIPPNPSPAVLPLSSSHHTHKHLRHWWTYNIFTQDHLYTEIKVLKEEDKVKT